MKKLLVIFLTLCSLRSIESCQMLSQTKNMLDVLHDTLRVVRVPHLSEFVTNILQSIPSELLKNDSESIGLAIAHLPLSCRFEIVQLLRRHGANINAHAKIDRVTPLIQAIIVHDKYLVRSLLLAGADVNAEDAFGNTALMWALASPECVCVEDIFTYSSDIDLRVVNNKGFSFEYCLRSVSNEAKRKKIEKLVATYRRSQKENDGKRNNLSSKNPMVPTLDVQQLEEFENTLDEILQKTVEASQIKPIEIEEKIGFKEIFIPTTRPTQTTSSSSIEEKNKIS